jgi:hypothetical protein
MEVDFTSGMRAFGDPSVVPAYFYVYGHTKEGYGFADILVLLRLLFPCLCKPEGVSVRFMLAAWPPVLKCRGREMLDTKSSLCSASDRRRFSSPAVDMPAIARKL